MHMCKGNSWILTKTIDAKNLKFEKDKFAKGLINPKNLYFKDFRDGQIYRAVKIGSQMWMAENLNYDITRAPCYNKDKKSCPIYGRYYKWEDAQWVCPDGWRLPKWEEWDILFRLSGELYESTLLPAGYYSNGSFYAVAGSYFWSATKHTATKNPYYILGARGAGLGNYYTLHNFSVRCVKDN